MRKKETNYRVSGGPMIVTLHWKTLLSSTKPAEKPSTGFFIKSDQMRKPNGEEIEGLNSRRFILQ
jgi:hypothetical protein